MTRMQRKTSDRKAFSELRSNVAVMSLIYFFLPLRDRVRLGEVNKEFLEDEHRGSIVGARGDQRFGDGESAQKCPRVRGVYWHY